MLICTTLYYTTDGELYWLAAHTNTGSGEVITDKFCDRFSALYYHQLHYTTMMTRASEMHVAMVLF